MEKKIFVEWQMLGWIELDRNRFIGTLVTEQVNSYLNAQAFNLNINFSILNLGIYIIIIYGGVSKIGSRNGKNSFIFKKRK